MLKYALLAGAMMVAAPALAQTAPIQTQPGTSPSAPTGSMPGAVPTTPTAPQSGAMDAASGQTAQSQPAPVAPADGAAMPTESAQTTTQPANEPAGVAGVVEKEWASYDKDQNGQLSMAEFAVWMDALKASAPAATPTDKGYNAKAFAQADKDKSKSLSKVELTSFLSGGGKAAS